jgi:hypothetical protein
MKIYFNPFKISLPVLLAGFMASRSPLAVAADLKAWDAATNPETKERYIPVELWSGAEWDGKKELKMPKVDASYKHSESYRIKGPTEWKHPDNGQTYVVYERLNPGRRAGDAKWQLFAINQEQSGLGRVYDTRPDLGTRTFSGGLKFPLGVWKEGETRKFLYKRYEKGRESERVEFITIKQIDFTFQNMPHCLEFYWAETSRDENKTYDHHTYIYCPGKSMVSEIHH